MANVALEMQKLANSTQLQLQELANQSTAKSFEYNSKEAETSRNWQTEMSNTSHQREVKDLIAAGLNPVLSSGGNGAASYTTSSASAQADNAVSAIGQLQSTRMSGLANMESARINAAAVRNAAAMQAAATRDAAAASYAASIYNADKNFTLGKYKANLDYLAKLQGYQWNYKTAMDKPVSSWSALMDKHLEKSGTSGRISQAISNQWKAFDTGMEMFNKIFVGKNATTNNFKLSNLGTKMTNSSLNKLGLAKTSANRTTFIQAYIFNNKAAQNRIADMIRIKKNKSNSARTVSSNYFNGSRYNSFTPMLV